MEKTAKIKSQISRVKVKVLSKKVVVELPKAAANYLRLTGESSQIYAVPINGVVQLASMAPTVTIPVSRITEDDFIMHGEEG